jgi:hypothetical protein
MLIWSLQGRHADIAVYFEPGEPYQPGCVSPGEMIESESRRTGRETRRATAFTVIGRDPLDAAD